MHPRDLAGNLQESAYRYAAILSDLRRLERDRRITWADLKDVRHPGPLQDPDKAAKLDALLDALSARIQDVENRLARLSPEDDARHAGAERTDRDPMEWMSPMAP